MLRAAEDREKVFDAVSAGHDTLTEITAHVGFYEDQHWRSSAERRTDRALQSLRRAGVILFNRRDRRWKVAV